DDKCTATTGEFQHTCSIEDCDAECESDDDCGNNSCSATYDDYCNGKRLAEYDSDKIKDSTMVMDSCLKSCKDDCTCTDCSTDCSAPELNEYCVEGVCSAECDKDNGCECPDDKCIDADNDGILDDYADYNDYGACSGDCECMTGVDEGEACEPSITLDDGYHCGDCEKDSECDDGLYCNGEELCFEGFCEEGDPIDCSYYNIGRIATCDNDPDNNPFTLDYFSGFTSLCDEANDECTKGSVSLMHSCDKDKCYAECESDEDCNDIDIYTMDECLADCSCTHREIRCFDDDDCDDNNMFTSDKCVNAGMTGSYCTNKGIRLDFIPRKKFFIGNIRINNLAYDEVRAGDLLFVDLNFENIGRYNTRHTTIRVTEPELGISRKLGPFRGPDVDKAMSRGLYLEIPGDAKPGVYTLRISLSDTEGIRRTRHRDFKIIQ
ncbi:hypothetical protein KY358_04450, partial [Candidatus Woesearchaeota archaeon]|nr:hypothetical protein [Candidatus Woesearchaeota archaeon]